MGLAALQAGLLMCELTVPSLSCSSEYNQAGTTCSKTLLRHEALVMHVSALCSWMFDGGLDLFCEHM